MCLNPIIMYDTGKLTDKGKRLLSTRRSSSLLAFPEAIPVPCGKCIACLESRRSEWVKRLKLESLLHPSSSFVTLTYDNSHLPSDNLASKSDIQKFLKRLRFAGRDYGFVMPSFRYFIVCEYGNLHHRPHYHGLLFGLDFYLPEWKPRLVSVDKYPRITSDVLSNVWKNGFVLFDRLTMNNISYVSKYITKQSDDVWSLKSMGLAKSLFVSQNCFTSLGVASLRNGFVSLPSPHGGFVRSRPPRFLDRYAEKFDPSLYDTLKQSRRDYVKKMVMDDPSLLLDCLQLKNQRENQKRKLDHDS